jgi:transposase
LRSSINENERAAKRSAAALKIDALDAAMATLDAQVEANLGPFRTAVDLVMSIPRIKNLGAHVIVSEIGIDMSRFPSDAHLISLENNDFHMRAAL